MPAVRTAVDAWHRHGGRAANYRIPAAAYPPPTTGLPAVMAEGGGRGRGRERCRRPAGWAAGSRGCWSAAASNGPGARPSSTRSASRPSSMSRPRASMRPSVYSTRVAPRGARPRSSGTGAADAERDSQDFVDGLHRAVRPEDQGRGMAGAGDAGAAAQRVVDDVQAGGEFDARLLGAQVELGEQVGRVLWCRASALAVMRRRPMAAAAEHAVPHHIARRREPTRPAGSPITSYQSPPTSVIRLPGSTGAPRPRTGWSPARWAAGPAAG